MIPQIFLITPAIEDALAFRPQLEKVLSTQALAVVLLRFAGKSDAEVKGPATALRALVQDAGVAALIEAPQDARLVARLGLDGAQVSGVGEALSEALSSLKPDRIVGVAGVKSRHDAMEAGERDIDYLMFGEPRPDGSLPALAQTIERAEWWAGIFNVPCVAYAPDIEAVEPLTATGAEFVALGEWVFAAPDPAEVIAEARRRAKAAALARAEAS
ncbi:MAG: thiamine phosphate synthase [Proteobacteria bacterium]|nr:thiamine phosphate synthase [Pseudomonadota bacterium]